MKWINFEWNKLTLLHEKYSYGLNNKFITFLFRGVAVQWIVIQICMKVSSRIRVIEGQQRQVEINLRRVLDMRLVSGQCMESTNYDSLVLVWHSGNNLVSISIHQTFLAVIICNRQLSGWTDLFQWNVLLWIGKSTRPNQVTCRQFKFESRLTVTCFQPSRRTFSSIPACWTWFNFFFFLTPSWICTNLYQIYVPWGMFCL